MFLKSCLMEKRSPNLMSIAPLLLCCHFRGLKCDFARLFRSVTVLFSDILGLTEMSGKVSTGEIFEILDRFLACHSIRCLVNAEELRTDCTQFSTR